jgi:hypothetical protein
MDRYLIKFRLNECLNHNSHNVCNPSCGNWSLSFYRRAYISSSRHNYRRVQLSLEVVALSRERDNPKSQPLWSCRKTPNGPDWIVGCSEILEGHGN